MRKKVVQVQRLSICPCGFPALDEKIGIGAEYVIDLDSLRHDGFHIQCGGCKTLHHNLASVNASQIIHPERQPARLPYSIFIGSGVQEP